MKEEHLMTNTFQKMAAGLERVSPSAPMSTAAAVMALASSEGRSVTSAETAQLPPIPEGATRAEYARILREK
jgi:hypothetical protein